MTICPLCGTRPVLNDGELHQGKLCGACSGGVAGDYVPHPPNPKCKLCDGKGIRKLHGPDCDNEIDIGELCIFCDGQPGPCGCTWYEGLSIEDVPEDKRGEWE